MKKATLANVAKLAGVSTATVSRYLKQGNVRPDIAEKIQNAINETGYAYKDNKAGNYKEDKFIQTSLIEENESDVNTNEDNILTAESFGVYRVAMLCAGLQDPHRRAIITALQEELANQGIALQLYLTNCDPKREVWYLNECVKQNVDAILIEGTKDTANIERAMEKSNIPVIYLHNVVENRPSLILDEKKAGEVLGKFLLQKQHLIIRYLGNHQEVADAHKEGIKKAYHDLKQPCDFDMLIAEGKYLDLYDKVKEIFIENIDLLILESDEIAVSVNKYLREYHITVPQNVSIISFGGREISRVSAPVMTSLAYNYETYAQYVVDCIIALWKHQPEPEEKEFFYIQEGDSVR